MAKTSLLLPKDFIALDVETTGLDANSCEIIELALVTVRDFEIVDRFSSLVKPCEPIPYFITCLTGISNEMVEHSPKVDEVLKPLIPKLDGSVVVGHNVCFDSRFIQKALGDFGLECHYTMVDTLRYSRHVQKNLESRKLDSIADACGVSVEAEHRHRALYDAEVTALCAICMWPMVHELYGDDPDSAVIKSYGRGTCKPVNPDAIKPTVDVIDDSNPFFGSNILFTGKMEGMTRAEAMQKAVNLGAIPLRGFTKKVDYLVVGSFDFVSSLKGQPSSKLKKAEKAITEGSSIQIVSESFFAEFASEV